MSYDATTIASLLLAETERQSDQAEQLPKNSWVYYTVIGASGLVFMIIFIVLYDLCCRCREYKNQHIADGGPPATPSSTFIYRVGIRADEASSSFDLQQSVIKIDMMDHLNRYLTTIAVPSYLLKFKVDAVPSASTSQQATVSQVKTEQMIQLQETKKTNKTPAPAIKSFSEMQDIWATTQKGNLITFFLVRRYPLVNLSSMRVTHDCHSPGAILKFKYIVVHDPETKLVVRSNLADMPIQAAPPCPPSGFQVFAAERVSNPQQLEEVKSFMNLIAPSWCCC